MMLSFLDRGRSLLAATGLFMANQLDDMSRKVVDFIAQMSEWVGPISPAPPQGAGKQYIAEANSITARSR